MTQTEAVLEITQLLALALAAVALATVLIGLAVHRKSKRLRFRRVSSDRRLVRDTWQRNASLVADLIQARNYAELEAMVKAGQADPNQKRDEPGGMSSPMLVDAVGKGEVKLAQALIDHPSIDCNLSREDGTTPLIMAASRGHETLVDSLLKLPSLDLNARNSNRSTALIVSARPGHATIVRMLLGAGVDRTCAQYRGLTALHFACRDGHLEIAQYLLSNCDKETIRQMLEARDKNGFTPLMYSCQRDHHTVAQLLLDNMDDVISSSSDHGTALHVAATHDSSKTMRLLSGKLDPKATDSRGRTALDVAEVHGSHSCAQILIVNLNGTPSCDSSKICKLYQFELVLNEQAVQLSSEEFSLKLHRAMLDSGYSSHRAVFQAGAADLLAELGNISELRDRFDKRKASGSFADGWGSSLQRLNGSVASSSDVDMSVQQRNPVHVEGSCKCLGAPTYRLEEGFLRLPDVCGDKPSRTDIGVGVRPSMDFCSFRPSCCIPIELRTSLSKLPKRFEFPANPEVEFVRSVRPKCTDVMEMRISCTSLEKAILRQLSTCQGQVFVLVKYIFKQLLAAKGLKSYHSKTLMFYLVCEISEEQWTADRLECLVVAALHRFEQFVIESEEYGASNCMPHFFIRDAWVYFKTGSAVDRRALIRCLQAAQRDRDVRSILASYMSEQLRPLRLGSESPFVFQPFSLIELVTPFKRPKKLESGQLARYQDIYLMLFKILADIGNPRCTGERCEGLSRDIDSLPERAAATVRAVLRVLLHLKLGSLSSARQVLKDSEGIQAKRSIDFQHPQSVDDAKRIVLHQLETSNCAWKFCFYFNEKPDFQFLSDHVTSKLDESAFGFYQLPGHLLLDFAYFVNFDAALKVLSMCLIPERSAELVSQWYSELCSEEDSNDIYELYLFAKFSRDAEQLKHCLLRMRSLSIKMDKELDMIEEVEERLNFRLKSPSSLGNAS